MAWTKEKAREYSRNYRKTHPQPDYRQKYRQIIREAKSVPCADCGKIYPYYVMDFDHVRGEKLACVGQVMTCLNMERLLAEIAKCEVVCSNCHRERTYGPKKEI